MFEQLPEHVSIYEVSPRDGLQNEPVVVPTHKKRRLVESLIAAGLMRIEMTSFVSPRWVPQLADAEDLANTIECPLGVTLSALCPNMRGLERAIAAHISEIGVFVSASETHNKKNVNKTIAETLGEFAHFIPAAHAAKVRIRGYVSTLWGCPYEGTIDPQKGVIIAQKLIELGCYQVSLGDTIGVGTPLQTQRILKMFLTEFSSSQLALHLHDTRGTALANIIVGLEHDIRDFDASVGGLGGCPYAPGAAGNLATEDLVYALHGMGIQTGIDLERLCEAGRVAASVVGHSLPGKVHQAGIRSLRT